MDEILHPVSRLFMRVYRFNQSFVRTLRNFINYPSVILVTQG